MIQEPMAACGVQRWKTLGPKQYHAQSRAGWLADWLDGWVAGRLTVGCGGLLATWQLVVEGCWPAGSSWLERLEVEYLRRQNFISVEKDYGNQCIPLIELQYLTRMQFIRLSHPLSKY